MATGPEVSHEVSHDVSHEISHEVSQQQVLLTAEPHLLQASLLQVNLPQSLLFILFVLCQN